MPVNQGPQQIKSLQRGTIALTAVASANATISAVDMAKAQITFQGWTTANADVTAACMVRLVNTTTLTASKGSGSGTSATISYEVIEWY